MPKSSFFLIWSGFIFIRYYYLKVIPSSIHANLLQVACNSGGKHCLALSVDGEVYSWGEGEDGKLGHGNRV